MRAYAPVVVVYVAPDLGQGEVVWRRNLVAVPAASAGRRQTGVEDSEKLSLIAIEHLEASSLEPLQSIELMDFRILDFHLRYCSDGEPRR